MYPKRHSLFLLFTLAFASSLASDGKDFARFKQLRLRERTRRRDRDTLRVLNSSLLFFLSLKIFIDMQRSVDTLFSILNEARQKGLAFATIDKNPDLYKRFTTLDIDSPIWSKTGTISASFQRAIQSPSLSDLKLLIEFGFNPNCTLLDFETSKPSSPLMYALSKLVPCILFSDSDDDTTKKNEYMKIVEYLVQHDKVAINFTLPKSGLTALNVMADRYSLTILDLSMQPLTEKLIQNHKAFIDLVRLLLKNRACPEIPFTHQAQTGKHYTTTACQLLTEAIPRYNTMLEKKSHSEHLSTEKINQLKKANKALADDLKINHGLVHSNKALATLKAIYTSDLATNNNMPKWLVGLMAGYFFDKCASSALKDFLK